MDVGKNIRHLRELKNLSQENMAAQMDISQRTYSDYEIKGNKISIEVLLKIANILETNLATILDLKVENIFNNNGKEISTLNNSITNNGIADKERNLYEAIILEKEKRIEEKDAIIKKIGWHLIFILINFAPQTTNV